MASTWFVGRRAEISSLRTRLNALSQGQGGTVLVLGEAGAGKSALLEEALIQSQDPAARVVRTAGDELSQVFPLLPFVEAVGGARQADIAAILRGGTAVTDPAIAASEELVAWLEDLCAQGPVVFVLDDLHWADAASVRLWNRLTRLTEQIPLLVAGTARHGHGRSDVAAIVRRVTDLAQTGQAVLVDLPPLSPDESAQLVANLVDGTPGARLTRLAAATAGNPLYLTELTGALVRDGALTRSDGVVEATTDQPPASLASAISTRLDAVPPDIRDLLRVAALLGVEFDVSDLAIASGRGVPDLLGLLDRALAAGLLTTTPAAMAFRHPVIREVLCEQVSGSVRAAWHQEVGRALAQAGRPSAAVARQLIAAIEAGGELPASDWLVSWLVREGEGLANRSVAVARTLFTQALSKLPPGDPQRATVAEPLAAALLRANEFSEAARLAAQTLGHATRLDPDVKQKLQMIELETVVGRSFADAMAMVDRFATDPDFGDLQRMRAEVVRARVYAGGLHPQAGQMVADALTSARRLGDTRAAAHAHHAYYMLNFRRHDMPAALMHADEGLSLVRDDPDALDLHMLLAADRVFALIDQNRWGEVQADVAELRRLAERTGNERRLKTSVVCDVLRMFLSGQWDDLIAEVSGIEEDENAFLVPYERAAVVLLHRDDMAGAERYYALACRITDADPDSPMFRDYVIYLKALMMEHRGDLEGAFDLQLNAALNVWTTADVPTAHVVDLGLRLGRRADAEKVVEFAEEKAFRTVRDTLAMQCRGILERDPEKLDAATAWYRARDLRLWLAEAAELAGLAWAERGEPRRARCAMSESLETYEALGAVRDVRRVRAEFRAHGLRTGSKETRNRAATGWASLTSTEVNVVGLVAEGLSNRVIAEQLYLSRRTVDTHVSHILQKLGLRSRVEVARMALTRQ